MAQRALMLEIAGKHGVRFDAVQMPLNVMDAHFRSFQRQLLPELIKGEIGVLGMKSMGGKSSWRARRRPRPNACITR